MKRFWRNVFLIALAHVALIAGLIRWSLAARASSNPESIMWLGDAGDFGTGEPERGATQRPEQATPSKEPKPSGDKSEEQKPVLETVPQSRSEIELPSATPQPTPRPTPAPKPSATPKPKPKRTPGPTPRPKPKKTLLTKTSSKAPSKSKPTSRKTNAKLKKSDKKALAKTEATPHKGGGNTSSTSKSGRPGGGSVASEFGWYGDMLHDRFYRAWIQPTANVASGSKISTLVRVRIEKDGRVSKFEIIKPSGNAVVNESVRVVAKQVTHVDAPPTGLIHGEHYDVKINFELNTNQETANQ